jgi:hypothetical protein
MIACRHEEWMSAIGPVSTICRDAAVRLKLRDRPTLRGHRRLSVVDSTLWTGRVLQVGSENLERHGLALLYPALEWSVGAFGHHGYPRASGGPFINGEFVAHDSRLRFGSLNQVLGGIINPLPPVEADSNTLTSAFGATAEMGHLLLARTGRVRPNADLQCARPAPRTNHGLTPSPDGTRSNCAQC